MAAVGSENMELNQRFASTIDLASQATQTAGNEIAAVMYKVGTDLEVPLDATENLIAGMLRVGTTTETNFESLLANTKTLASGALEMFDGMSAKMKQTTLQDFAAFQGALEDSHVQMGNLSQFAQQMATDMGGRFRFLSQIGLGADFDIEKEGFGPVFDALTARVTQLREQSGGDIDLLNREVIAFQSQLGELGTMFPIDQLVKFSEHSEDVLGTYRSNQGVFADAAGNMANLKTEFASQLGPAKQLIGTTKDWFMNLGFGEVTIGNIATQLKEFDLVAIGQAIFGIGLAIKGLGLGALLTSLAGMGKWLIMLVPRLLGYAAAQTTAATATTATAAASKTMLGGGVMKSIGKGIQFLLGAIGKGIAALGSSLAGPQGLIGLAAIAVLTGAIIGLGFALKLAAPFITALLTGVAETVDVVLQSFAQMDIVQMLAVGPAMAAIGVGFAAMAGGLIAGIALLTTGDLASKVAGFFGVGSGRTIADQITGFVNTIVPLGNVMESLSRSNMGGKAKILLPLPEFEGDIDDARDSVRAVVGMYRQLDEVAGIASRLPVELVPKLSGEALSQTMREAMPITDDSSDVVELLRRIAVASERRTAVAGGGGMGQLIGAGVNG
jgi:hypothetical protein